VRLEDAGVGDSGQGCTAIRVYGSFIGLFCGVIAGSGGYVYYNGPIVVWQL